VRRRKAVCCIAYANYHTDARIKNYVDALLRNGYRVDVVALGDRGQHVPPGVRLYLLMRKVWSDNPLWYAAAQLAFALAATLLVTALFVTRRYRVVHVHNMPNFLAFCALPVRLLGARTILDVHDTMPEAYATKFGLRLGHPLIAALRAEERASAAISDAVIATNVLHKEVLVRHGIPERKIEIVMNVANPRFFDVGGAPPARPPAGEVLLMYHGTIARRLGLDLIVEAFAGAADECPGLRLLVVGEGDFRDELEAMVASRGLADRVRLVPFVPVEDLAALLAGGHAGVVGNRAYTEEKENYMLPVKMLEYAAMEIPTLAPRLRTIETYFGDDGALFYRPDDAADLSRRMVEVCRDPARLDELRPGLRRFNETYSWAAMEDVYLALIRRLTGPDESPGADFPPETGL
jgi:glycosyltransferase involved in cell wall biosynthesis